MDTKKITGELNFKAVRSSGSGGQHVNKVASKVELYFNVHDSNGLNPHEIKQISRALKHRISQDGILKLTADSNRSQHKNKALVIKRFLDLLRTALQPKKKRKHTKIPKSAIKKRLKQKHHQADKKANRKPPTLD